MTTPARIEELERLYARLRPIMDYDDLSADRNALWTLWVKNANSILALARSHAALVEVARAAESYLKIASAMGHSLEGVVVHDRLTDALAALPAETRAEVEGT